MQSLCQSLQCGCISMQTAKPFLSISYAKLCIDSRYIFYYATHSGDVSLSGKTEGQPNLGATGRHSKVYILQNCLPLSLAKNNSMEGKYWVRSSPGTTVWWKLEEGVNGKRAIDSSMLFRRYFVVVKASTRKNNFISIFISYQQQLVGCFFHWKNKWNTELGFS